MKQQMKALIFFATLFLMMMSSVARADDLKTQDQDREEMSQDDREILEAMDSEFTVTLKTTAN